MLVVGEIVRVRDLELDPKSNKSPEPLLDGPATSEHMSALLPFEFAASVKYNAILDSFVTTTPGGGGYSRMKMTGVLVGNF